MSCRAPHYLGQFEEIHHSGSTHHLIGLSIRHLPGLFPTFMLWSVSDQVCGFPLRCFVGNESPVTTVQTSVLILCNSINKRLLDH